MLVWNEERQGPYSLEAVVGVPVSLKPDPRRVLDVVARVVLREVGDSQFQGAGTSAFGTGVSATGWACRLG
jgi:hypothetical protein